MQDSPPSPQGRVDARSADGWERPGSDTSTNVARALRKRLTPQEARLWVRLRALRPAGFHFRRQVPIGNFVVDFACLKARLIVEVDGGGHTRDGEAQSDKRRDMILEQLDYRILRFWNSEVQANIDGVIETIILSARQTPPPSLRSAPSPDGRDG